MASPAGVSRYDSLYTSLMARTVIHLHPGYSPSEHDGAEDTCHLHPPVYLSTMSTVHIRILRIAIPLIRPGHFSSSRQPTLEYLSFSASQHIT
jgi:hypothetical protein